MLVNLAFLVPVRPLFWPLFLIIGRLLYKFLVTLLLVFTKADCLAGMKVIGILQLSISYILSMVKTNNVISMVWTKNNVYDHD
jgi:hypothetical protein